MENIIKTALGTTIFESTGYSGGGSISTGSSFLTDKGLIFVKVNHKENASLMFEGEKVGLNVILKTGTIRVPKPITVVNLAGENNEGAAAFVMEYLKFGSINTIIQEKLGEQLAKLHQYNGVQLENLKKEESSVTSRCSGDGEHDLRDVIDEGPVNKFGFNIPTCCGYLSLDNSWNDDWTTFYIRQRLQPQVDGLIREYGDRELLEAWNKCHPIIEKKLNKIKNVIPSLLHGDLWSGNFSACDNEPVIFDPATFYGHNEFDLGIGYMFGGFRKPFYESYHKFLVKTEGFNERRDIYELFHHLNHWNHFGNSYKNSTLQLMRNISQK